MKKESKKAAKEELKAVKEEAEKFIDLLAEIMNYRAEFVAQDNEFNERVGVLKMRVQQLAKNPGKAGMEEVNKKIRALMDCRLLTIDTEDVHKAFQKVVELIQSLGLGDEENITLKPVSTDPVECRKILEAYWDKVPRQKEIMDIVFEKLADAEKEVNRHFE